MTAPAIWPVDQTILGDGGDCYRCCIASILGVDAEQVPHILEFHSNEDVERHWFNITVDLARENWRLRVYLCDGENAHAVPADVATIIGGDGPRGRSHAVVGIGTEMVHDPHPSRAGLTRVTDFMWFRPLPDGVRIPEGRA